MLILILVISRYQSSITDSQDNVDIGPDNPYVPHSNMKDSQRSVGHGVCYISQ